MDTQVFCQIKPDLEKLAVTKARACWVFLRVGGLFENGKREGPSGGNLSPGIFSYSDYIILNHHFFWLTKWNFKKNMFLFKFVNKFANKFVSKFVNKFVNKKFVNKFVNKCVNKFVNKFVNKLVNKFVNKLVKVIMSISLS